MRHILVLLLLLWTVPAWAAVERPEFDPQLGRQIDLTASFTDSTGRTAPLGDLLQGRTGLVLFGYHDCPNQCGVAQQVIAAALARTGLGAGVVPLFITLAPEEKAADAAAAKARLAAAVGPAAAPWRFLSGPDGPGLGEAFGIGAIERERIRQYVHPVAVFTLTPDGRISHVLPGLDLGPEELKLALVDASNGTLGSAIDHIVLWCAGYDASAGRYTPAIIGVLRVAGAGTVVLGLAGLALLEFRRRRWTP
jgi:protein SCO1/2